MNYHPDQTPTKKDILKAAIRIGQYIHKTPVLTSENLNSIFGCQLYFKCENLQKAGAFKSRGAVNTVFSLNENDVISGVCTHSSGNHAAALSRAASLKGIVAHIVMPEDSSKVKISAVKHYGGKITFCKPTLASRETALIKVIEKTAALEVHPYNDPRIIAGQATAAMEMFGEIDPLDIIMAPVGGGGLLSGTALAANYFSDKTKVIAAEPEQADDAFQSFKANTFYPSVNPNTIADGLRTSLGSLTFPIIQKYVDDIVTVSEKGIVEAMKLIWERMKIIVEPSSAVPLAAILEKKFDCPGKKIGIIISGGNVDLNALPW
ncbi:MAG: serine dehydratase [Bacteroidetes bacterium 4484_276]|nr:MAG: serine dehydratase [Bacteroidetes bacterium 4484_276]OYT13544.1 MAG: serine dehydratase [Bacteroidetes bacterium 4572_114]